jgi:hypothetical protein
MMGKKERVLKMPEKVDPNKGPQWMTGHPRTFAEATSCIHRNMSIWPQFFKEERKVLDEPSPLALDRTERQERIVTVDSVGAVQPVYAFCTNPVMVAWAQAIFASYPRTDAGNVKMLSVHGEICQLCPHHTKPTAQ